MAKFPRGLHTDSNSSYNKKNIVVASWATCERRMWRRRLWPSRCPDRENNNWTAGFSSSVVILKALAHCREIHCELKKDKCLLLWTSPTKESFNAHNSIDCYMRDNVIIIF
ncbi:hypothetical protein ACQJBY_070353 [Aegilops geniculata]